MRVDFCRFAEYRVHASSYRFDFDDHAGLLYPLFNWTDITIEVQLVAVALREFVCMGLCTIPGDFNNPAPYLNPAAAVIRIDYQHSHPRIGTHIASLLTFKRGIYQNIGIIVINPDD